MLQASTSLEPGVFEFEEHVLLEGDQPVHILGKKYDPKNDLIEIKQTVRSLSWITYRRDFPPIGGTGPDSDRGWGCMLRCGQMVMARAMKIVLCPDQDLTTNPQLEREILSQFGDHKNALYSVHNIATMGEDDRLPVGDWYTPNNIAQVLRRLCVYDKLSMMGVHIAMDNLLITDDVKAVGRARALLNDDETSDSTLPGSVASSIKKNTSKSNRKSATTASPSTTTAPFSPVLIFVPLRLGLVYMNEVYHDALHQLFALPYCVGVIGGRPNHALYFVGSVNLQMIYLDPHTTHQMVDMSEDNYPLDTYHCEYLQHMFMCDVDPSLAVAMLCKSEDEVDKLAELLRNTVLPSSTPPLFELLEKRPHYLDPFVSYTKPESIHTSEIDILEPRCDTDEEFELLA